MSSRMSKITASTFARGGWRVLQGPVQVTHGGQGIGLFLPTGSAPIVEVDVRRLRIKPRRHPDDPRLNALEALMDAQAAVLAVEELAAEVHGVAPGQKLLAEYQRRRAAYFVALKGPAPATAPEGSDR